MDAVRQLCSFRAREPYGLRLACPGSYSNVDMTYGALATYVARHPLPMAGPTREYYLCGPQGTAVETAWRTETG